MKDREKLLFALLPSMCDDRGNTYGDGKRLREANYTELYMYKAPQLDAALDLYEAQGLIKRYWVKGERYLHYVGWEEDQQIRYKKRSPIPSFEESDGATCARDIYNNNISNYKGEAEVETEVEAETEAEEKRKEKIPSLVCTYTDIPSPPPSPNGRKEAGVCVSEKTREQFDRFWSAYPRKVGRRDAFLEFCRIAPDEELLARMLRTVKAFSESERWRMEGGRYVPNPKKWLEGEHWTDELDKTETAQGFQHSDAEMDLFFERALNKPFRTHRED
jgi:hypothetical protein